MEKRHRALRILVVALAVGLALGIDGALAKSPRPNGGLSKSTETPTPAPKPTPKPTPPPKPAPTPRSGNRRGSGSPSPTPAPPVAPPPSVPTAPKPKPPEPKRPTPKKRCSNPLEQAREDLRYGRDCLELNYPKEAFREAIAVASEIKKKELDKVGLDGRGAKADEFRKVRQEANQLAEEASKRLAARPSTVNKKLTFYF